MASPQINTEKVVIYFIKTQLYLLETNLPENKAVFGLKDNELLNLEDYLKEFFEIILVNLENLQVQLKKKDLLIHRKLAFFRLYDTNTTKIKKRSI